MTRTFVAVTLALTLVSLAGLVSARGGGQNGRVLNLFEARRSSKAEKDTIPAQERLMIGLLVRPVMADAPAPRPLPFSIVSFEIDQTLFNLRDLMSYTVRIRNISKTSAPFPVATEVHRFRRSMSDVTIGSISFRTDGNATREPQYFGPES